MIGIDRQNAMNDGRAGQDVTNRGAEQSWVDAMSEQVLGTAGVGQVGEVRSLTGQKQDRSEQDIYGYCRSEQSLGRWQRQER